MFLLHNHCFWLNTLRRMGTGENARLLPVFMDERLMNKGIE